MDVDGGRRVFNRLGQSSSNNNNDSSSNNKQHQKVCFYWRQGKCNKFPCPFLHSELPAAANVKRAHQGFGLEDDYRGSGGAGLRRSGNYNFANDNKWSRGQSRQPVSSNRIVLKKNERICREWEQGS